MKMEKQNQCVLAGCAVTDPVEDRWVDRDEFTELAVSPRKLVRMDDAELDLLGLLDPENCIRFVTPRTERLGRRPH
ncbi:MAG: hypothetical protein U0795_22650 [Pirellulales bacterium]